MLILMIIGIAIILSIMSVNIRVITIIVTITSIITCEADKEQFMNSSFLRQVELLYEEPVSTIVNATGMAAHNAWYPNGAQCMAFSPYHKGSRDAMAEAVAANVRHVWHRDGCVWVSLQPAVPPRGPGLRRGLNDGLRLRPHWP